MPRAQSSHSARQLSSLRVCQMNLPEGPLGTGGPSGSWEPCLPPGHLRLAAACPQLRAGPHDVASLPAPRQVTVQYTQERGAVIPVRIHTIVISVQHNEDVTLEDMRRALKEQVIRAVVPAQYLDKDTIYHLQPSGRFVIGGPQVRPRLCVRPCRCSPP